ncbi:hypothetical protein [Halobacterium hubeiense]|uniref:hypothetical protein n=1 Tax=Halobacterium hubeiense TaxID=1407499 RepID=UPI00351E1DB5
MISGVTVGDNVSVGAGAGIQHRENEIPVVVGVVAEQDNVLAAEHARVDEDAERDDDEQAGCDSSQYVPGNVQSRHVGPGTGLRCRRCLWVRYPRAPRGRRAGPQGGTQRPSQR